MRKGGHHAATHTPRLPAHWLGLALAIGLCAAGGLAGCSGPAFELGPAAEGAGDDSGQVARGDALSTDEGGLLEDVSPVPRPDVLLEASPAEASLDGGGADGLPGVWQPDALPDVRPGVVDAAEEPPVTPDVSAVTLPTSCLGLPDGATTLALPGSGKPWGAWCHGGLEYLTLPPGNDSTLVTSGVATGTAVVPTLPPSRFDP